MRIWDFGMHRPQQNDKLKSEGLYITHLFPADQVFLRRDWERYLVQIARPPLKWLRLFRPATIDLILSKMMRGNDPQDMADAEFMIRQDRITEAQLRQAFLEMNPVELVELRDAFDLAKPIVLKLAREVSAA